MDFIFLMRKILSRDAVVSYKYKNKKKLFLQMFLQTLSIRDNEKRH